MNKTIYDFKVKTIKGEEISLELYKGKTLLIVNTASECGLTPQFEGLESLYQKYKDQGLVILGFPCNQFGGQEPGDNKSIESGCLLNYGVSFPMFDKIEVNGNAAHPLFVHLKRELKGSFWGSKIKWNFTKFLIDKTGNPIKRFSPVTTPEKIDQYFKKKRII